MSLVKNGIPRIDVDRAAREALRTKDGQPDLLRDGIPFEPGLYYIVLEPIKPRTVTEGGIEVVDIAQQAEGHQITIGRVLKAGPESMSGKTASGIDLSNFLPHIRKPEDLIGKYFIYMRHVGQEMMLRATGQRIKVMLVTDLLGETSDANAWRFYI